MLALRELGFAVLVPFGENTRYDLVIDDGVALSRVQCKTGRLRQGAIRFKACSTYAHHRSPERQSRSYLGDVDFFAVHCPETDGVYLVPIADVPVESRAALRLSPAKNGQRRRTRAAQRYEIGSVAVRRANGG